MYKTVTFIFGVVGFAICTAETDNNNIVAWEERPCVFPQKGILKLEQETLQGNNEVDETVWYVPLYQKYELYQTCSLVSGIPVEQLTDDDIKKSCLTMTMAEPGAFVTKGFDGKKMEVVTTPGKDGGLMWRIKGEKEFRGEFWITLAAENYTVAVTCWANGHRSFSAASKTKAFDPAARNIIVEHVTLLGFDPKNFYFYSYDDCKIEKNKKERASNIFSMIAHMFWSYIL